MQRPHHMLSELETTYFFLLERKASVVDIREQWPILHIDRTLELCAEQGASHKFRGAYPEPFTIDFVVTEEVDGKIFHRAASIKTHVQHVFTMIGSRSEHATFIARTS